MLLLPDEKERTGFWGVAKMSKDAWSRCVRSARSRIGQDQLGMPAENHGTQTIWEDFPLLHTPTLKKIMNSRVVAMLRTWNPLRRVR